MATVAGIPRPRAAPEERYALAGFRRLLEEKAQRARDHSDFAAGLPPRIQRLSRQRRGASEMISHAVGVLATTDKPPRPSNAHRDLPRSGGDHRRVLAVLGCREGNGCPRRSLKARRTPGRRKGWCAGPTEPGNVVQTPIYE